MGVPSFPACALAPTLPLLAIATGESTVILLDTRDRQVIQELDVGSGYSSQVAGVHFLSDDALVVVGGRGDVTFFGARSATASGSRLASTGQGLVRPRRTG